MRHLSLFLFFLVFPLAISCGKHQSQSSVLAGSRWICDDSMLKCCIDFDDDYATSYLKANGEICSISSYSIRDNTVSFQPAIVFQVGKLDIESTPFTYSFTEGTLDESKITLVFEFPKTGSPWTKKDIVFKRIVNRL